MPIPDWAEKREDWLIKRVEDLSEEIKLLEMNEAFNSIEGGIGISRKDVIDAKYDELAWIGDELDNIQGEFYPKSKRN